MVRRLLVFSMLLCAVVLVACGGKDNKTASTTPTVSTAPTGPTGSTAGATNGRRSKRGSRRSRQNSTGTGGVQNLTPANSKKQAQRVQKAIQRTREQIKRSEQKAKQIAKKSPAADQELNTTSEAYHAAKTVCGQFLPDTYIAGKNHEDIARSYAKPWPAKLRDSAYKGCLVGLKQPRPHSAPAD